MGGNNQTIWGVLLRSNWNTVYFLPRPPVPVLSRLSWHGKYLPAKQLYSCFHVYLQRLADVCTGADFYYTCCWLCISVSVCESTLMCLHTCVYVQVSFYIPVSTHASEFLSLIALAYWWNVWEREWGSLFFCGCVRAITFLFISDSLSINEEGHICARMYISVLLSVPNLCEGR